MSEKGRAMTKHTPKDTPWYHKNYALYDAKGHCLASNCSEEVMNEIVNCVNSMPGLLEAAKAAQFELGSLLQQIGVNMGRSGPEIGMVIESCIPLANLRAAIAQAEGTQPAPATLAVNEEEN